MSVTIKSNSRAAANLKYAVRDNLLKTFATTSNNVDGIQLFSLDDKFSYQKQANPSVGDVVNNLGSGNADMTFGKAGSNVGELAWDSATKSIDLSTVSVGVNGIRTIDNWLANEFNGQNKHFILSAYVYIPNPADWHEKSGGLVDFAGTVTSANSAVQTEVFGALAFIHHPTDAKEYAIWARFSRSEDASGAYSGITYSVEGTDPSFPFGQFAQVSLVRDSTGNYIYIVSAKGVVKIKGTATGNTGKDVAVGTKITWGRGGAYSAGLTNKYKLNRGFIINLNKNPISDVQAFLKADWDRQVARGWIV